MLTCPGGVCYTPLLAKSQQKDTASISYCYLVAFLLLQFPFWSLCRVTSSMWICSITTMARPRQPMAISRKQRKYFSLLTQSRWRMIQSTSSGWPNLVCFLNDVNNIKKIRIIFFFFFFFFFFIFFFRRVFVCLFLNVLACINIFS